MFWSIIHRVLVLSVKCLFFFLEQRCLTVKSGSCEGILLGCPEKLLCALLFLVTEC